MNGLRGAESIFPLDGTLNLPIDKYSQGSRQRVAQIEQGGYLILVIA